MEVVKANALLSAPTIGEGILSMSPKSFLLSAVAGAIVIVLIVSMPFKKAPLLPLEPRDAQGNNTSNLNSSWAPKKIPFIQIQGSKRVQLSNALFLSLDTFRKEISQAVQGLSQLLEKALELEETTANKLLGLPKTVRLSSRIEDHIQNISKCLEEDEKVLQSLLKPFDMITALPNSKVGQNTLLKESSSMTMETEQQPLSTLFKRFDPSSKNKLQTLDENAYDSAAQIVAHLVRDWSTSGANIRKNLYDWCRIQLVQHTARNTIYSLSHPVLVPGAGMGRLAYDLYREGYTVEANELSPVMAAAAYAILQRNAAGTVHPYALDMMSNEVDSNRRYDTVSFPDTKIQSGKQYLSFTIGDFVGDYYFSQENIYGAVVTCFFIDTATNIYEYIELIRQLLKPGGVWVNVGPVQWHRNALLHPSVDELKDLIAAFGFDILHWNVDHEPVPYRQDDSSRAGASFVRTTNFEAYRPLRFVATRWK